MQARHRRLMKLERRNKKSLETLLVYLLLTSKQAPKASFPFILQVPTLISKLAEGIQALHFPAYELANRDSEDFLEDGEPVEPEQEPARTVQIRKASRSLILAVAASQALRQSRGEEFQEAVEGAIEDQEARVTRIATTETFQAYTDQYLANTSGSEGEWQWDALLDKMTCPQCESLNGTTWARQSDVPVCPAHSRCRCIIEFYPTA